MSPDLGRNLGQENDAVPVSASVLPPASERTKNLRLIYCPEGNSGRQYGSDGN